MRELGLIFCSRRPITRRVTRNFIPQVPNMIMLITQSPWTGLWKEALMMWGWEFFLDWSCIGMSLQDFWCMQSIWKLLLGLALIPSVCHGLNVRMILILMCLTMVLTTIFLLSWWLVFGLQCLIQGWLFPPEKVRHAGSGF